MRFTVAQKVSACNVAVTKNLDRKVREAAAKSVEEMPAQAANSSLLYFALKAQNE